MYMNSVVARFSEAYTKLFEMINFTVLTSVNIIIYFILYMYIYLNIYNSFFRIVISDIAKYCPPPPKKKNQDRN